MRSARGNIGALLVSFERRSFRLAALSALLLALVLASLMPYGRAPSGDDGSPRPTPTVAARAPKATPALPEPSLNDREGRAVDALAGVAIRKGGGTRHLVALTFDDGPGPYTEQVVRELERLKVPATFFQVGRVLSDFPAAGAFTSEARDVVIGDHTFNHAPMSTLGAAGQQKEILDAADAMLAHGEAQPRLFRPPYGMWNDTTKAITRKRGMPMILWSVDSEDYERPGVDQIVKTVMREVAPGAIVLMHDAGGDRTQTVAAIPKIVRRLRKQGYGLVTVPKLLLEDPPTAADEVEPGDVVVGAGGG